MFISLKYLSTLFMLFACIDAFGQNISGVVLDKTSGQPVVSALVQTANLSIRTNSIGRFEIEVKHPDDSLRVTAMGYKTIVSPAGKPGAFLTIQLEPSVTKLNEVTIHGTRDFKQDSLANRLNLSNSSTIKHPR